MKKLLALLVLITSVAQAQYSVKGTMNPPNNTDWVILYKIEGAKQLFIDNTNIKMDTIKVDGKETTVGTFEFTLPADAKTGMYRTTYRQDTGGFVNFLFNKEDVELSFNPDIPEQTISFTKSEENKVFNEFLQANSLTQSRVDSLQITYLSAPSKSLVKQYKSAVAKVNDVKSIYQKKATGMLASHFIKAMTRNNAPEIIANSQEYFDSVVNTFFDNLDFNSKELYNSSFLIDRITDYVFYLNYSAEPELQNKLYKESVAVVMDKVTNTNLKKETLEYLATQFAKGESAEVVDELFSKYYNKLPQELQDYKFKSSTLGKLQAAIGRTAPNFSWKENGKTQNLSSLKDGENYLLIFWSTSCSHCVKEIPEIYTFLKDYPATKVVAYGIEKEDFEWNEFIKQLYGWHHAIGLNPENKWDNTLVTETYQVHATPAYFVLDANKKIIAKPYELADVKKYFKGLK